MPATSWRPGFGFRSGTAGPERAAPLVRDGAQLASSPAEAVANAGVVLTMLTDGDAVMQVMSEPGGAARAIRPGSVWVQMATVGVEWTERFATIAAENHVEFVDAPVSGSDGPARDRQLLVLASGPEEERARLDPIFDAIGRKTLWLGPAGQGTRLKLVLNNWLATQVEAVAETIALSEGLGVNPDLFIEAIDDGPLGSPYAVMKGRGMIAGEFTPGYTLGLALKDVGLALDAAGEMHLDLPVTSALPPRWREAIAEGHADEDVSVVIAEAGESNPIRGLDNRAVGK